MNDTSDGDALPDEDFDEELSELLRSSPQKKGDKKLVKKAQCNMNTLAAWHAVSAIMLP